MAENGATAGKDEQAQPPQLQMRILGQFIRDLSFENIMAQKGVSGDVQPDIQVQVNLDAKKRGVDHQFEVSIKLNVTSKAKESGTELFLLEIDYVGIFHVEGVPEGIAKRRGRARPRSRRRTRRGTRNTITRDCGAGSKPWSSRLYWRCSSASSSSSSSRFRPAP